MMGFVRPRPGDAILRWDLRRARSFPPVSDVARDDRRHDGRASPEQVGTFMLWLFPSAAPTKARPARAA